MQRLHDPDTHRLGKKEAVKPHAMLSDFVDFEKAQAAITVPANIVNSAVSADGPPMSIALAMYLNDREGDCTCAGVANTLRLNSNGSKQVTDDDVQAAYVAVTAKENSGQGYNPQTGANDNGCIEVDVLDYWVASGVGGDKLLGHAGVDMTNEQQWRMALYLSGSLYPGWALSTDQQSQQIWDKGAAAAGSWGGHCAPIVDHWTQIPTGLVIGGATIDSSLGEVFNVATWGGYKACAKGFIPFACDEGHVLITDAWLPKAQQLGIIDQAGLDAYLKTLQSET